MNAVGEVADAPFSIERIRVELSYGAGLRGGLASNLHALPSAGNSNFSAYVGGDHAEGSYRF